ncbi:MAG: hypothetical protein U0N86_02590 [Lachnospiraceae bacterium]
MEDYLRRTAIWPGAPVIDDPEGLLGEKVNRLYMFSHEPINPSTVTAKEEIFSRKAFTAALLGELKEENDWAFLSCRKEKWKNGKESMPQLFILWYNRPILMYGGQVNEGL